ncbi:hypothetical protein WG66_003347 [Moniliophthora roreri]|nr:hypothetical protein WG66_003347 [Moniliophthora roreri]
MDVNIPFEGVSIAISNATFRLRALHWSARAIPARGIPKNAALALNTLLSESGNSLEKLELHQGYGDIKNVLPMFNLVHNVHFQSLHLHLDLPRPTI